MQNENTGAEEKDREHQEEAGWVLHPFTERAVGVEARHAPMG